MHGDTGEVELDCGKYKEVREKCFDRLSNLTPQFSSSAEMDQMQMLWGKDSNSYISAKFVSQQSWYMSDLGIYTQSQEK